MRQSSSSFDGAQPILRLRELLDLLDDARDRTGRDIGLVAEVKHPTYFASIGLPLDELLADELAPLEQPRPAHRRVLRAGRARRSCASAGIEARYVYLLESKGSAPDLVARFGRKALPYAAQLTASGLARLAHEVDGVSVDKNLLLDAAKDGTWASPTWSRASTRPG